MTFEKINYLSYIILGYFIFMSYSYFYQKKYFNWIKDYWAMKPKKRLNLSLIFYSIAFLFFALALMDLRGKPILEKGEIPDQRTIILIDSSSSMLAEDIKPNRYLKALTIARMFIKNAVGHQISVVAFSDVQKKIIPFTDDIDLLDSRVSGLSEQDIRRGGSNVKQAIQETLSYFLEDSDTVSGNLLVLTDAEDNGDFENISLPEGLSVAFIGVGTLSGSAIPLRSENGGFDNYKMHKGEKVITRLDEGFLKLITGKIKNSKYWIATSYSMPVDEVLSFFKKSFSKKIKNDVKAKPAKFEILIIPGLVFLFISFILSSFGKTFRPFVFCLIIMNYAHSAPVPKEDELDESSKKIMSRVKEGKLKREALLDVAEKMLRKEKYQEAKSIYNEQEKMTKKDSELLFNYGTSQMQSGEIEEALTHVKKIEELDEKLARDYKKNLLSTLMKQKQKDEKKEKDKQEEKNKNQENKEGKDQKENQEQNKGQGKSKDQDNKDEKESNKEDQKNKSNEKEQKDKEEKEKKQQEEEQKKQEQHTPKDLDEKENKLKQSRKMVKVPALLQQLMSDDRNLQKKFIDTDTFEKNKEDKDW